MERPAFVRKGFYLRLCLFGSSGGCFLHAFTFSSQSWSCFRGWIQATLQVGVQRGAFLGRGEGCRVFLFAFVVQVPFCSSDAKFFLDFDSFLRVWRGLELIKNLCGT